MTGASFQLLAADEWTAHDPFGEVKPADSPSGPAGAVPEGGTVSLCAARGGYASFRVLVRGSGRYRLSVVFDGGLEVELHRAWYHPLDQGEGRPKIYLPDALVPTREGQSFELPDPDNRVPGQKVQEFWVDVYAPPDAKPGAVRGRVRLRAGSTQTELPVRAEVLEAVLPEEPCVVMDHNSYGTRWLPGQYPRAFARNRTGDRFWQNYSELLHNHFRVVHEHRGVFHNLGYGHSGQFDPIYGPRAVGQGREKHLQDWEPFDRHHGPLLDGSAFRSAAPGMPAPRRAASPIWGIYTPLNPDWPASYLWWGEPGYEAEFTGCVGEFDAHFRARGWTRSRVEFFFNHKKRYRWFEWDGDEAKFAKDDAYHLEMIRLWKQAIGDTPVPWHYRMDSSWQMKAQFERLANPRNFWVLGGFCAWYPEEIRQVIGRGEIAWWYGGYPSIGMASSCVLQNLYRTWARGLGGFCAWSTASPGRDPWFDCNGAATGALYPGERFGVAGPIPSVRLKLLRNGIQDIDLIDQAARQAGRLEQARAELISAVDVPVWTKPPRAARELPPEDWDSVNLNVEHEPVMSPEEKLGPRWWTRVRELAVPAVARNGKESR